MMQTSHQTLLYKPVPAVTTSTGVGVTFLNINDVSIHENHDQERVNELCNNMVECGHYTTPILVDDKKLILLDGHHRFEALSMYFGASQIPAILIDYDDETMISVSSWRSEILVDRDVVRQAALSQRLLPKKTSRHTLAFDVGTINIPFSMLGSDI